MDFKAIAEKVKQVFQQRGGAQAAKEDAEELRDIAQGQGSATKKATAAAEAIREPGAHEADPPDTRSQGACGAPQPN